MKAAGLAIGLAMLLSGCCGLSEAKRSPQIYWTQNPVVVPFVKITRGAVNVVKAPLDVPATMLRVQRQEGGVSGVADALTVGAAEGVVNGGARAVAGAAEILSFPLVNQPAPLYVRQLGEPAFRSSPRPRR